MKPEILEVDIFEDLTYLQDLVPLEPEGEVSSSKYPRNHYQIPTGIAEF